MSLKNDIYFITTFLNLIEKRLKEKELLLQNGDTGRDYEHCMALIKKADEAVSTQKEQHLLAVLQMGDKLVRQGRTDRHLVLANKNRLLDRSKLIRAGMHAYKQRLHVALEAHVFTRDHQDLQQRLQEKRQLLSADADLLRTLDAVQAAQKKLADIEGDLKATVHPKLLKLREEAARLRDPDLDKKVLAVESEWNGVEESLGNRRQKLDYDLSYQKFMIEFGELKAWLVDIGHRIEQSGEPGSLAEAETAINLHEERKTEVEGKNHRFVALQSTSRALIEKSKKQCNSYSNEFNQEIQKVIFRP